MKHGIRLPDATYWGRLHPDTRLGVNCWALPALNRGRHIDFVDFDGTLSEVKDAKFEVYASPRNGRLMSIVHRIFLRCDFQKIK